MPVIGITGGKGGVGKTTVAANLAAALAAQGWRTALVDADVDAPNGHLLLSMTLEEPRDAASAKPVFHQELCSDCQKCVQACRMNSLFRAKAKHITLMGECNGCEACMLVCPEKGAISRGSHSVGTTYKSTLDKLTLYTGALHPGLAESAHVVAAVKERALAEAEDFDVILVDTSPGTHCNVIGALKGAVHVLAVTEPTPLGAHDLDLMLSLLDMFHVSRSVIINRADLPGRKEDIDRVAAAHSTAVTAALPLDKELLASYLDGVPVVRSSPDSLAATVFMEMAEHIAAQHIRKEEK